MRQTFEDVLDGPLRLEIVRLREAREEVDGGVSGLEFDASYDTDS